MVVLGCYAQVMQWPGCGEYIGDMEHGVRHGKGMFKPEASNFGYEGSWQYGKRHGQGRLTFSTEPLSHYEGELPKWEGIQP